jgi:hypothetical protein
MARVTLAVFGLFASVICVFAGARTGNELFSDCNDKNPTFNAGFCDGYINGLLDEWFEAKIFCPATGVTLGQTKDMVIKYLRTNPELRHLSAPYLVHEATKNFACHN